MNKLKYDFLDFGASKAASIEFAKKYFGGEKGLGIDLDPERVKAMKKAGYECMVGDLTNLDLPDNCARYVKMAHILEHMPDLNGVENAIMNAQKCATEFLVITGPFFDEDDYLQKLGLKLEWSDYPEHTCHLTIEQLVAILEKLGLNDYELYVRLPIKDSSNKHIHPIKSPAGSHAYDSKIHPPKKHVTFDRLIWTDFVCYVRVGSVSNWEKVTKAYKYKIPYIFKNGSNTFRVPKKLLMPIADLSDEIVLGEETIKQLKEQNSVLKNKLQKNELELNSIKKSKAWKFTRKLQKASLFIRKPTRTSS